MFGGSLVQLFFLLSGFGLYLSYNNTDYVSWKEWAKRRINKILKPYWVVVLVTALVAMVIPEISSHGPAYEYDRTIVGLLSYLLLFRNVYPPAWGLNVTFWFMPVIIGLYAVFPFLIKILNKYGPVALLLFSFIVNYASIAAFVTFGLFYTTLNHQRDWFVFYTLQFAAGMLLAYYTVNRKLILTNLSAMMLVCFSIGCYGISVFIKKSWSDGRYFNDLFTTFGAFFIIYCLCRYLKKYQLIFLNNLLVVSGKESYMIYLIHFPLIIMIGKMMAVKPFVMFLDSSIMIFTGMIFFILVLTISKCISVTITRLIEPKVFYRKLS